MIEIDGGRGEGGGAILRNAVALSAVLGEPIEVFNIRKGRTEPGLKMQHLTGVKALAEICGAKVSGLEKGSTKITFNPGKVRGGRFRFDVGTAGSLTLVLQSLLPAIAFAEDKVELELVGGTDVAWSPPFDYLKNVLLPVLEKMGFKGKVELGRRGFYPKGGGLVRAEFEPVKGKLKPIRLLEQGKLLGVEGISVASGLPEHVAERQATAARKALFDAGFEPKLEKEVSQANCPGTSAVLWANFDSGAVLGASSLGERGKPAEKVGEEAAKSLVKAIGSKATVDAHLCDQLLAFVALAEGGSELLAEAWSSHSETNAWLIRQFIKKEFEAKEESGKAVRVRCAGIGFGRD